MNIAYNVAAEWTPYLPGRKFGEGKPKNGVEFFKQVLKPQYLNHQEDKSFVFEVDFSEVLGGIPPSFIDDSFGSFAREYGIKVTLSFFKISSAKDPNLSERASQLIKASGGNL